MRGPLAAVAIALLAAACVPNCGTDALPQPATGGPDAGALDSGAVGGGGDGGVLPDAGPDGGPDAGPIACATTGAVCGANAECCSNRCPSGACGPMCVADGQACLVATDCCSLACNGGTCGGAVCAQHGTDCAANDQCCSNACVGTKCAAVLTGCRPAGERCTGGPFVPDVCCGTPAAACLLQGQAGEHCDLPPDVCRGAGVACTLAGDCCSNVCTAGFCG